METTTTAGEAKLSSKAQGAPTAKRKSRKGWARVACTYCGRRHYLRPGYAGYEEQALCGTCERQLHRVGEGAEG